MEPSVAQIADLPPCSRQHSDADVLCQGLTAFVAYDVAGDKAAAALVRFGGVCHVVARGPNDDTFESHPYFSIGLHHFALQEIVASPWIEAISAILNSEAGGEAPSDIRHFVFGVKETTVDVLARSYTLLGLYPNRSAAMRAAMEISERDKATVASAKAA